MTIYMARVPGAPKGYQRILRWNTDAYFACPDLTEHDHHAKHESVKSGTKRAEIVSDERIPSEPDADGSHLVAHTVVRRVWAVTKAGRKPTCKCGREMEWLGWYVWVKDELIAERTLDFFGGLSIRNATGDKEVWKRYAKTLKERQRLIDKGYAGK